MRIIRRFFVYITALMTFRPILISRQDFRADMRGGIAHFPGAQVLCRKRVIADFQRRALFLEKRNKRIFIPLYARFVGKRLGGVADAAHVKSHPERETVIIAKRERFLRRGLIVVRILFCPIRVRAECNPVFIRLFVQFIILFILVQRVSHFAIIGVVYGKHRFRNNLFSVRFMLIADSNGCVLRQKGDGLPFRLHSPVGGGVGKCQRRRAVRDAEF